MAADESLTENSTNLFDLMPVGFLQKIRLRLSNQKNLSRPILGIEARRFGPRTPPQAGRHGEHAGFR
jgi:hypothetical protein